MDYKTVIEKKLNKLEKKNNKFFEYLKCKDYD